MQDTKGDRWKKSESVGTTYNSAGSEKWREACSFVFRAARYGGNKILPTPRRSILS